MIILDGLGSYNTLFSKIDGAVNLWRVEQAIDNKKNSVIPSYLTLSIIRNYLNDNSIETYKVLGIDNQNTDFVHSLAMWAMNGHVVKLAAPILPFIYDMNLLDHIEPSVFFNFPSQCLYIDNKIGCFDGALVCKDYIENGQLKKDFMLNISLISKSVNGLQFSFLIPKRVDENFLKQFEDLAHWDQIKPFFLIFIYILYEYSHKQDFFTQKAVDYIGYDLADRIEQNKLKSGYWRKGHWHTYFVKNNGIDQFVMKLIQPTWVNV